MEEESLMLSMIKEAKEFAIKVIENGTITEIRYYPDNVIYLVRFKAPIQDKSGNYVVSAEFENERMGWNQGEKNDH